MEEIGNYLRQVRTEKNISLKDIQEATKIRIHYLEAIENGDFEAIPGEVYRKGFLVNYANAIGLDGQEVLARYYQSQQPQVETLTSEVQKGLETVKKKNTTRIRLKNSANLWVFAAIVVVIIAGLVLTPVIRERTVKLNGTSKAVTPATQTTSAPIKPKQDITPSATENMDAAGTDYTQVYPAPVTVYAEFSEDVWVQVTSDGQPVFVEDGQKFHADSPKQVWTAQKEITINIGNPAGLKINLNGKDLGTIGERGIPKLIKLTPDGLVAP